MSQRFKASKNLNNSKNTRLDIAGEFSNYRFGRDQLAHVSRYLYIVEQIEKIAKLLGRPIRILDIGCGDIYIARILVSTSRVKKTDVIETYVGLDIDDVSLARTSERLPSCMPIRLVCGDVTTGALEQFGNKVFDLVVCTEVVEHLQPEFVALLFSEIRRVGVRAVISTPNITGGTGRIPEDHIKEWDCKELTSLMEAQGLKVKRRIGIFCNLDHLKRLCVDNPSLQAVFRMLKKRMDKDFLSICMARFIGEDAQNVLYICECGK